MKRTLLLALGSFFLQTAVCLAQGPSGPPPDLPPAALPSAGPVIIDQGTPSPLSAWMGGSSSRSEPRTWASAEYLTWWTKGANVSTPLVTQALVPIATDPTAGRIGSANTAVVLGNQTLDLRNRSGGRVTLGGWFDCDSTIGIEANYLAITPRSVTQLAGSNGSTTIGLPFFNVNTLNQAFVANSIPAAGPAPATSAGTFLRVSNRLQGGELNGVFRLVRNDCWTLDGLAGFRYVNFQENLDFGTNLFFPGVPPTTVTIPGVGAVAVPGVRSITAGTLDGFHANNNFYGGQLGLRGQYQLGNFVVQGTGKVALGSMSQTMNITGSSFVSNPGAGPAFNFATNQGGFYAQRTNIGNYTRNVFCAVPEAELKLGYNVTRNIQVFAAYNFMYLSNVERPGNAIDHNINPSVVPVLSGLGATPVGVPAPNFGFNRSDFWAQGINVGVQFKF
jgi:hypothetical protein